MKIQHLILLLFTLLQSHSLPAQTTPEEIADRVMAASGAARWPRVERIRFTFRVVIDGQEKIAAKHDWNVSGNLDTVTWAGKTVTVDLAKPGTSEDEKAAFQRWTNDAYWLLAPLKLKDRGTTLRSPSEHLLEISFEGVGLTPGDRYLYEIDPATSLPKAWTYMPNAEVKKTGTWEKYVTSGGLTLSTYHRMGDVEIWIDGLEIITKP